MVQKRDSTAAAAATRQPFELLTSRKGTEVSRYDAGIPHGQAPMGYLSSLLYTQLVMYVDRPGYCSADTLVRLC